MRPDTVAALKGGGDGSSLDPALQLLVEYFRSVSCRVVCADGLLVCMRAKVVGWMDGWMDTRMNLGCIF